MRKTLGIIGAVATCPCHIPIWLGLLGGTVIGAKLSQNLVPVLAVATTLFLAFLALALVEGMMDLPVESDGLAQVVDGLLAFPHGEVRHRPAVVANRSVTVGIR